MRSFSLGYFVDIAFALDQLFAFFISRSEKGGRSETRACASCIAQPTGAAANDIGADDR